jgi:O-antigen/teichoic acid export membrane protein
VKLRSLTATLGSSRSARNVLWNAIGGGFVGVMSTVATPWYVSRLGFEGYGVVGLWMMMQVMAGLLDLGMGATLVKGFAGAADDPRSRSERSDLLKTLEYVYWTLAAVPSIALALAAPWIATRWLHSPSLSPEYLTASIRMMSVALALQFPCSLYASGLAGLQDHGRMNRLQIIATMMRFGGGAAILGWRADLVWFFLVQSFVAIVQTLATRRAVWRQVRVRDGHPSFQLPILRRVWRFSAGMALTASTAVLLSNMDRVVLSRMRSTVELGKYSLAFTAAGLLQMGILPFYRAHFPRYSELVARGDGAQLRAEYFRSCRVMAAVIIPIAVTAFVFAPLLFRAWIGREDWTIIVVFRWLLVGVGTSGLMWLPAALQQAHGWTRLHASIMLGALLLGAAVMVPAISRFGTAGATAAWVIHGVSDITLGLLLMHRRLLVGCAVSWARSVIVAPLGTSLAIATISWLLLPNEVGRWNGLAWVAATAVLVLASSFVGLLVPARHSADATLNQI